MPQQHNKGISKEPGGLKVAYVTFGYRGAKDTFLQTEVNALRDIGIEVKVFPLTKSGDFVDPQNTEYVIGERFVTNLGYLWRGFKLFALCCRYEYKSPIKLSRLVRRLPAALNAAQLIDQFRPSIIHFFWGHYPALVGEICKGTPIISHFLGAYDLRANFSTIAKLYSKADVNWTHCYANIDALKKMAPEVTNICVNYRGIEIPAAEGLCSAGRFEQLGKTTRIIVATRLIPEKEVGKIIDLCEELSRRGIDTKIDVYGDGPCYNQIVQDISRRKLSGKVFLMGYLPHNELLRAMSDYHFAVLFSSSSSERLPNFIKEAMARFCVPIVNETPGIHEMIEHLEDGFICGGNDVATAADFIACCANKRSMWHAMATAARAKMELRFDVNVTARMFEKRWRHMLDTP